MWRKRGVIDGVAEVSAGGPLVFEGLAQALVKDVRGFGFKDRFAEDVRREQARKEVGAIAGQEGGGLVGGDLRLAFEEVVDMAGDQ